MIMHHLSSHFWFGIVACSLWLLGLGAFLLDSDDQLDTLSSCTAGDMTCSPPSRTLSAFSLEDYGEALSLMQRQAIQLTGKSSSKVSTGWAAYDDFLKAIGLKGGKGKTLPQKDEDHLHEVMDGADAASGLPHVTYKEGLTIAIHPWKLSIVCVVVGLAAFAIQKLRIGIADQLIIASIRLSVQMVILGYGMYPLFLEDSPYIVIGYILIFMLFIASWEAAARPKLMYPGMLYNSVLSILFGLVTSITILTFVVAPRPWYSARYTVPLSGMLVQFSLTGVAPALNMLTEFLASRKEHVEVLLSLGATPYEACWPCFTLTVRQALIPSMNSMNVAGLVTIPGMMAGQIIGGADPQNACLYQIAILTIGSVCAVIAICSVCLLSIRSLFDERGRLQSALIVKQGRSNIVSTCAWFLWPPNWCRGADEQAKLQAPSTPGSRRRALGTSPSGKNIQRMPSDPAFKSAKEVENEDNPLIFENKQPFAKRADTLLDLDITGMIALTNPVSVRLSLHEKEVACIMGPSGIGKSTILKMVNDLLSKSPGSKMELRGKSMDSISPQEWRRDVMYIHQSKAPLPGCPADLLEDIKKMKVNKGRPPPDPVGIMEQLGLPAEFLQRPWAELSGGEAQRVTCSITLSMKPTIMLMDEPTSGLDDKAKVMFEKVLAESGCTSILVTHDEQQAARIGSSVWKLGRQYTTEKAPTPRVNTPLAK